MKLAFDECTVQVGDDRWRLDRRIIDAVQHDGRVFVVFDYMAYPSGRPANNLVAYDLSGNELWVVGEHPIDDATAAYVNVIAVAPLTVGNFAGFNCVVDPSTGALLSSQFTK